MDRAVLRGAVLLGLLASSFSSVPAGAFPGICVGKDAAERVISAVEIVLMQHRGFSIVTIAADYEGPLAPFALVLPVPADVVAERVRTVKRGIIARLDEVSAPRFHAFYEQDPCDGGRTEQRWDERIPAVGRGFLAPEGMPPLDRRYAVSNEISAPIEPVFKAAENEFRYRKLEFGTPLELSVWLGKLGYVVSEPALAALAPYVGKGKALLLAEVATEHVELVDAKRARLGGIRYFSKLPRAALPVRLGLQHANATQDLLLYVLDRSQRYEIVGYENLFVPGNLRVAARASESIGRAYAALFEAVAPPSRPAFVSEYAWSTRGCGEPCADAPLGLDELMSLGGDVLEAETTSAAERAGEPALEEERDRAKFTESLGEVRPAERAAARREHSRVLAELGRRRALSARQTYVLSRLHHRYAPAGLPKDVELAPARAVRGGVGIPSGKQGVLSRAAEPASENELQVRLVSLKPWNGPIGCASPARQRWGKPWPSEARAARAVPLATDILTMPAERKLLLGLLEAPVPELGIGRAELRHAAPPPAALPSASAQAAPAAARGAGCAAAPGRPTPNGTPLFCIVALWFSVRLWPWHRLERARTLRSRLLPTQS